MGAGSSHGFHSLTPYVEVKSKTVQKNVMGFPECSVVTGRLSKVPWEGIRDCRGRAWEGICGEPAFSTGRATGRAVKHVLRQEDARRRSAGGREDGSC